jgi:bacterial/archaeal transporter family-2 protein
MEMSVLLVVVVAVLGGLAGALQSQMLGVMEERVGTLASTFVTYAGGGLAVTILMLVFQGSRLSELRTLPWWVYGAGIMGLVIVAALGVSVANLGLAAGLTLFTASILVIGAVIEHFGWFGDGRSFDLIRLIGVALVIGGTWLVVRG